MSDVFVLCCFNGDRRLIFLGKQIIKSLSPTKTFSFEETSILEDFLEMVGENIGFIDSFLYSYKDMIIN